MPDGVNFIAADIRPVAEAVSALRAEPPGMDRKFLSKLQRRLTKAKFQLRSLRDEQTQNYIETGGGAADPIRFARQTGAILEKQQRAAEELRSEVDALKEKFARSSDADAAKLIDESRDIALGWYVAIGILLLLVWKLAQENQSKTSQAALRARPINGKVDHAAITDEIIGRFPNILKVLAE
jgi:hypothetical protein